MSGNKYLIYLILGLCLTACSPKIQPNAKKTPSEEIKEEQKSSKKLTEANVSLLLPFKLKDINLKSASKAEVEKDAMAIDFYQGFKLGIDSAAALGLNFKLNIYDTGDDHTEIGNLLRNNRFQKNNLIIGPVFPEGLKSVRDYSISHGLPVVSPLAASRPDDFNNPNLISIVNNIDIHATKIGDYISGKYSPENTIIVLINPKKTEDEIFGAPLRNYFLNDKGHKFSFQEYASVYRMEADLVKDKKYVVIISSSEKTFVTATLDKLLKMKNAGLAVDLFGHPNWIRQNYSTNTLQALNTCITSSYRIDYKSTAVISFIKKYRHAFNFEPDEYAFKGFDVGFYFGKQLAQHGTDFLKYLTKEKYIGLHNTFSFEYDKKYGYVNTSLMLLAYRNYTLYPVQ